MNVIIRRTLKDYDAWKKIVTDLDGTRKQYGSKGASAYRNAANPNEVYLIFEWDDAKPFQAYLDLPEVKQAFAATGSVEVIEVGESFTLAEKPAFCRSRVIWGFLTRPKPLSAGIQSIDPARKSSSKANAGCRAQVRLKAV